MREVNREAVHGDPGAPPDLARLGEPPRRATPAARLLVCSLGTVAYSDALKLQHVIARARIAGEIPHDVLLLVEHPPVVTLGRSSRDAHLVASPDFLAARGVERFEVDRGGDVTFHGPGQLVGYPIIDLKQHKQDLHWYLRQVEEALIGALRRFGLEGWRSPGYTGVWVGQDGVAAGVGKIASIGVHARDWVTWHGFALNVTTDLSYFGLIVPCGIDGVRMTSISEEWRNSHVRSSADSLSVAAVGTEVASTLAEVLGLALQSVALAELSLDTAALAMSDRS